VPNDDDDDDEEDDDDDFKCYYKETLLPSLVYLCYVFYYLNLYT